MRHSNPLHFQDYQQAHNLTQVLHQSKAINKAIELIQQQTSPEFGITHPCLIKTLQVNSPH